MKFIRRLAAVVVILWLVGLTVAVTWPDAWREAIRHLGKPTLGPTQLTADDLAASLKLKVWKFTFDEPAGKHDIRIWIDEWRKGAAQPVRHDLSYVTVDRKGKTDLLIYLPNHADDDIVIAMPGGSTYAKLPESLRGLKPQGWGCTWEKAVEIGCDLTLVKMVWSEKQPNAFSADVDERLDDDITFQIRMRIDPIAKT